MARHMARAVVGLVRWDASTGVPPQRDAIVRACEAGLDLFLATGFGLATGITFRAPAPPRGPRSTALTNLEAIRRGLFRGQLRRRRLCRCQGVSLLARLKRRSRWRFWRRSRRCRREFHLSG